MALDDRRLDKLVALIRDSFRIRENQDPVYVEIGDHLDRVKSDQHQIIFGRRGSGKSCLLVHFHRQPFPKKGFSVYVSADEVKTLSYPDLLIRLLLIVLRAIPTHRSLIDRVRRRGPLRAEIRSLQRLLDRADTETVKEDTSRTKEARAGAGGRAGPADVNISAGRTESHTRTSEFREEKLDYLERHLRDFKEAITGALEKNSPTRGTVIVDDFYLIEPSVQPDVVDYLHRLARGTDLYLKIGTVRHRTALSRQNGRTIGVELYQDVESIDLDHTFEDVNATHGYLSAMLDSMGAKVGVDRVSTEFLSTEGLFALTLASGGVPRDYLTIFVEAVKAARDGGATKWLTPKWVYKGAARVSYRTKLTQLRDDVGPDAAALEPVFQDLLTFCLEEKKKTGFLISETDARERPGEHDRILQLMDFKLIHVVEPDTSAASGREGRYEAYTLDFAFFMEPRLRGLDHVEFWRTDEQRRRRGVREAPVYELSRVEEVRTRSRKESTEEVVEEIVETLGEDEEQEEEEEEE
jgi:hypothetical protein